MGVGWGGGGGEEGEVLLLKVKLSKRLKPLIVLVVF